MATPQSYSVEAMAKLNPMKYRIPVLKRLVPSIKKRIYGLKYPKGFMLRHSGDALFLLNSRNFVDRQIAFYDDFEVEQTAFLFAAMQRHGCDLFLDVGANIGYYSVLVALNGLAPEVLAFEPDERNRLQFGANVLLNGLLDTVSISDAAVSSQTGTVQFAPAADTSTGQSKIAEGASSVSIPSIALDDVVPKKDCRIFVKRLIPLPPVRPTYGR